jgi:hypothetical protein
MANSDFVGLTKLNRPAGQKEKKTATRELLPENTCFNHIWLYFSSIL